MSGRPAVLLDRDNTIIVNDGDLGDPEGVSLMPGAEAALARLHAANWPLIVITNQGGVARGRYDEDAVRSVHTRIQTLLKDTPILDWLWCPWHPHGTVPEYTREHSWRKPSPGMLLEAASRHGLSLADSWMVGDQDRDIAAGQAAQCHTILLSETPGTPAAERTVGTITEAVDHILASTQ